MYFHTVFSLGDWLAIACFLVFLIFVTYYYVKAKLRRTRESLLARWQAMRR